MDETQTSRRKLFGFAGKGVLSVAAISILGGAPALAQATSTKPGVAAHQGDIDILNVALGLELEAIEAYQIGAESGLLQKPVLDVAILFQGQHKGHRDALIEVIGQLGGKPVEAKSREEYMIGLNIAAIKSQTDILRLAQAHEKGAANAYIGVMPSFSNNELAQVCAKIAADEAAHWALLSSALGETLPKAAFMFG
jgi:rubrerythrin